MNTYETALVLADSLGQDDIDEFVKKVQALIEKNDGKLVETTPWGRKRLAYEVAGTRHAHFVFLKIEGPGSIVHVLDAALRIEKPVIRFQTFIYEGDPAEGDLHFKNYEMLLGYITDRGKIRPRRTTRMSAPKQRQLASAIKRARMLALLPYTTMGS